MAIDAAHLQIQILREAELSELQIKVPPTRRFDSVVKHFIPVRSSIFIFVIEFKQHHLLFSAIGALPAISRDRFAVQLLAVTTLLRRFSVF